VVDEEDDEVGFEAQSPASHSVGKHGQFAGVDDAAAVKDDDDRALR
jgi:hypothetical protein